jgi:3-isopropylmalate/(R)-2-methylmalate dehydratase small subunit
MPCVTVSEADVAALMAAVENDPAHDLLVDLTALTATYRGVEYTIDLPAGTRTQLLEGTWDGTRVLLDAGERIRQTAERLPYVKGFGK